MNLSQRVLTRARRLAPSAKWYDPVLVGNCVLLSSDEPEFPQELSVTVQDNPTDRDIDKAVRAALADPSA